ncbi:MAG: hypothetical protein ACRDLA_00305 [Thermoleophilaceae bacterium]
MQQRTALTLTAARSTFVRDNGEKSLMVSSTQVGFAHRSISEQYVRRALALPNDLPKSRR